MDLSKIISYDLIHATIRASTPIIYAAMAAVISRQANVFNIAIEGTMLFSSFFAVVVSYFTKSWILAVAVAIMIGVLVSAILATANLKYKANVVVIGLSLNMLGLSVTRFLMYQIFNTYGTFNDPGIVGIPKLHFAFLESNPVLNSLFNNYSLFEVLVFVVFFLVWFLLYRTVWGLRLRSVGLNETAALTAGINVSSRKYQAILISGVLAGIGGAHLSLGYTQMFVEGMSGGRGFMGVAAMNFGGTKPIGALIGCLIFGFTDSFGARMQSFGFPSYFVLMSPYVVTVVVLIVAMVVYEKKERRRRSSLTQASAKAVSKNLSVT